MSKTEEILKAIRGFAEDFDDDAPEMPPYSTDATVE